MSFSLPAIEVYSYTQPINLSSLSGAQLPSLATIIFNNISNQAFLTFFKTVTIDPLVLESLNVRYAEKQVLGIEENFSYYNVGLKIPQVNMNPRITARDYLTEKAFSGDVSGDIGESVFVYMLIDELRMNPDRIAHLRPEKFKKRLTPDFLVWEQNADLSNLLSFNYAPPLYVEVKSSTGSGNRNQIEDGLAQLKAVLPLGFYGFLFFLYRRNPASSYGGCLVGVM
jgi:hypothetical protein